MLLQEVEAKKLEVAAVNLAESGKYGDSLSEFNKAVALAPNMASLYNNRAQLYRLQGRNEEAMADIESAIRLSGGKGKTAMQVLY